MGYTDETEALWREREQFRLRAAAAEQYAGRLAVALRRLAYVPAVSQALGNDHTPGCNCPLCDSRALLNEVNVAEGEDNHA